MFQCHQAHHHGLAQFQSCSQAVQQKALPCCVLVAIDAESLEADDMMLQVAPKQQQQQHRQLNHVCGGHQSFTRGLWGASVN